VHHLIPDGNILIMSIYGSHPWYTRLLFSSVTPIIERAKRAPISEENLPDIPPEISVTAESKTLASNITRHKDLGYLSIARAILSTYRADLFKILGLSFIALLAGLSTPLLLREVLRGLNPSTDLPDWFYTIKSILPEYFTWISYSLVSTLTLFFASLVSIFSIHHIFYIQPILAFRVRAGLNAIIFDKALNQQRAAQQRSTSGFIVNLIGSDTQRIQTLLTFLHSSWHHPISLMFIMYILYCLVGFAALIGCSSLLILLLSSTAITRKQGKLRTLLSRIADQRIGLTRESLIHIKAAKLQGWECSLEQKIHRLREQELQISRKLIRLSAVFAFTSGSAPAIAMAITSVSLAYQGASLDAATLFPALTLFMQLRFSLNVLPETVYNFMEATIACKRIDSFLNSPEFLAPRLDPAQHAAISLLDVESRWEPGGSSAACVPGLTISRGELVVIVGTVGSGKSGLLLTMLGELPPERGSVTLGGTVSYVPQIPWITSNSIRNNILFDKPFEPERYQRAIYSAGLNSDLTSLPHHDNTQIGERGINLSGGQRQRVALARAVYSDTEIYLFDDPLSALDPSVAKHVFTQMICKELWSKTRILVSHRVEFALSADRVLVVENGSIVEDGSPDTLKLGETRFSALIRAHTGVSTQQKLSNADSFERPGTLESQDLPLESLDESSPTGEVVHSSIIEAEERHVGSVRLSTIRAYAARLAPGFAGITVALLFIGRQSAALGTDLWLTTWAGKPIVNLTIFLGGYLVCIALLCLLAYLRTVYILGRGLSAGAQSHKKLLNGVLGAPLSFFESNPVGRILNRFSRDLETIELALPRSILDAGQCVIETVIVALVIGSVTPVTLLLIAPVAILYLSLSNLFRPVSRELQRLLSISLSPIFALMSECLTGIESLRASTLGASFNRSFGRALDVHTRYNFLQTATNRWLGVRLETLGATLSCAVGVAASFGWSTSSGIAFSGLALAYASSMTSSMNWAIRSISMVENSLTSFERIERYSATPSERRDGSPAPAAWPTSGAIEFENLSVRYRPNLPLALKAITCSIPSGSRVGIIGRTGSGKSTLILSLLRLIEPSDGRILIDGIDLSSIKLADLRSSIAVVPQEPVLFSGTLRESLDPFNQYTDSEISSALKRVELAGLLNSLPNGLDSEVRESGFNFSNGQRQLICLARALLRKNKVVILDEATASIDVHTDQTIQRSIRREFSGSTLLVIAHRIGTVLDSDYILALQDGELLNFGAPNDLMRHSQNLLTRFLSEANHDLN
jgi:ATP-binding cassette subfamily C (CFTR/MRP) protein 1